MDLLIGLDNAELHYSKVNVHGPPGNPTTRLGPLGWTCIGQTGRSVEKRLHFVMQSFFSKGAHINEATRRCCDINSTLRKFWEIEDYGTETKRSDVMTKEEKFAMQKMKESLKHDVSHYSLAVPWKENCPTPPNNREMAMKRLESTERGLQTKDSFVKTEYAET